MTTKLIHGSIVSYQPERRTKVGGTYAYGVIDIDEVFLWPGLNTGFSIDVEEAFEEIQHNPVHATVNHILEEVRNVKVGEELAFNINVHPQVEAHWPLLKFVTGDLYGLGDHPDSSSWMKELDGKWSRFTGIMMEDAKVEIPGIGVAKESYSGFAGHRMAIVDTTPGYTEAIEDLSRPVVWNDIQAIQMGPIGLGVWGLETTPGVDEKNWKSICYGNGLYVAVADLGTLNRVMTSVDAETWQLETTPVGDDNWQDVAFGNGLFVAVASDTTGDCIMTSPNGKDWTLRTRPAGDQAWSSIIFGNGLFVAVASDSISNVDRVMTSPNGVDWTIQASVNKDNAWQSITHANGLFVAVSDTGTLDMVMTSVDAATWTSQVTPAGNNAWQGIVYGNGLYVAVASTGTLNRVMTSPNGVDWTLRVTPAGNNNWQDITYGNGLFVAVSDTGTDDRVMTSPNGVDWTLGISAADNDWQGIVCVNGVYVAVGKTGTVNRVMTSISTVIDIVHSVSDINFGFANEVTKAIDANSILSTGIGDVRVVSRKMFVSLKLGWVDQTFLDVVAGTERLYLRMAIGTSPNETTFEFWGLKYPKYVAKGDPKELISDTITSIVDRPGFRYSTK